MGRYSSTVSTIWVGWIPPPPSWAMLNTDGYVNIITNAASGRGEGGPRSKKKKKKGKVLTCLVTVFENDSLS